MNAKGKDWWRVGETPDQLDMALRKATMKRRELEELKLFQRQEPTPLVVRSIEDIPVYVRPAELAEKLRKSVDTVLRDIKRGALLARHDGKSWLIDIKDVPLYMERTRLEGEEGRKDRRVKRRSA